MIVRITNKGNRHYGHYGIVYKKVPHGRHLVLMLKDQVGARCIKPGSCFSNEMEMIPESDDRPFDAWPPTLCDDNVHTVATDLMMLLEDGKKFREIQRLLKDK